MCGFAAIFSGAGPVDAESLRRGIAVLVHRGPDSNAIWIDPSGAAGLADTRLGIVDPGRRSDQPLRSADDRLVLVHNGEFYDFERQRRALESRGHRFATGSDSEILLPLYDELGAGALNQLRGEFAVVLWDRSKRTVLAARDRFGIKPLFFATHSGRLYLASEVKALFAMGVPAAWDLESVFQYHQTWLLPPSRTLYRGVYQVPPGHFFVARIDSDVLQPALHSYWDFDYPLLDATATTDVDLPEEAARLRAKLEEAVRLRLRADVPVACYLSGGLDSCSVLGLASSLSPAPLHTFTLSFADDVTYDESLAAREAAAACNAVHHEVSVASRDLADSFGDALWNAELPFVNTNGVAKFLLSRAVRAAGFKAVLTGEGADEIFGGYVHFRKDVLLAQDGPDRDVRLANLAAANSLSAPMMLAAAMPPALGIVERTLGFVPSFLLANGQGTELALGLLKDDLLATFHDHDGWRAWLDCIDVPRQLLGRARLNQSLYLWSRTMLPAYLLAVLGDRMEMAHSVEGRLPFLDHELVEHVVRLPVSLKIAADLTEKVVLREAARPVLSDAVYRRQKQPVLAPPAAAAPASALLGLLQDTCRSPAFAANPFYDQTKVVALLDRLPSLPCAQQAGLDCVLTNVLSFALLTRRLGLAA